MRACAGNMCMGIAATRTTNVWTPLPAPMPPGHVHRSSAARVAHRMIPVVIPPATALPAPSTSRRSQGACLHAPGQAYYVSIVHGTAAIDTEWSACAARVRGVSGAQYRKVRSPEELAAFCAAHGVEPPQDLA